MTPEEHARQRIDTMLTASGWVVQKQRRIFTCRMLITSKLQANSVL
jgi:hypothetical protein